MEKICTKCNISKDIIHYYKVRSNSDKYRPICKTCINEDNRKRNEKNKERRSEVSKIWCENNKDKRRDSRLKRYKNDPEKFKDYHIKWLEKNPNYKKEYRQKNRERILIQGKEYRERKKDEINEKSRLWYNENKDKVNQRVKEYRKNTNYIKNRKKSNPLFRLKTNVRNLIRTAIIKRGYKKNSKSSHILGCSFECFKDHIESKWESWMTWENYGKYNGLENYGWDLDHIIPICSANTEEEVFKLNHYKNLQPLCSFKNRVLKRGLTDWENNL